jgi:hypothetical protein
MRSDGSEPFFSRGFCGLFLQSADHLAGYARRTLQERILPALCSKPESVPIRTCGRGAFFETNRNVKRRRIRPEKMLFFPYLAALVGSPFGLLISLTLPVSLRVPQCPKYPLSCHERPSICGPNQHGCISYKGYLRRQGDSLSRGSRIV